MYQEHGYDDDILDIAWNNIEAMRKRQNKYTGIYEIGLIGRCGNVYMFMISHPIDEYTVKVFHMMPLTLEDAEELDFYPGAWYDYPTSLTLSSDDMEEEW